MGSETGEKDEAKIKIIDILIPSSADIIHPAPRFELGSADIVAQVKVN